MSYARAAFLFGCVALGSSTFSAGPDTRLQPDRPANGRYVATDLGFMVPYAQPIPGSNAVIEMVPVPGGTVTLAPLPPPQSINDDGNPIVTPNTSEAAIEVSFGPFWIGKYEITMEQYLPYRRLYYQQREDQAKKRNQVMDLNEVDAVTGPTEVYDTVYNFEFAGEPNSPVPTASQFAARQYTKYLSLLTEQTYRLPMRSEWQHACLAGNRSAYCFGDDVDQLEEYAVYFENRPDESISLTVGTKKPNAWGIFDMQGNVSEFVVEDTAMTGMRYGHVACGGNYYSDAAECTATSVIRTTADWWDQDPDLPPSPWWMTSDDSRGTGFRILSPLRPMSTEQRKTFWDADSESLATDLRARVDQGRGSLGRVSPPEPSTRQVDPAAAK